MNVAFMRTLLILFMPVFLISGGSAGYYSIDHLILIVGTSIASFTLTTQLTWFVFVFVTLYRYPPSTLRKNVQFF